MRIALAQQNPFVTGPVTGQEGHYPESSHSLVNLSDPGMVLWSIKPAEDGIERAGIALSVWNFSDHDASFNASFPALKVVSAQRATHIETPLSTAPVKDGQLQAEARPHGLETYLLRLSQ